MHKFIKRVIHLSAVWFLFGCSSSRYQPTIQPVQAPIELSQARVSEKDPAMEAIIKPYREPLSKALQETLCYSGAPAVKELPEGTLGNLIGDILLDEFRTVSGLPIDVFFFNNGGLRMEWPAGPITQSMVFELMPFENKLQLVEMNAQQFESLCKQIAERGGGPISGMKMRIKSNSLIDYSVGNESSANKNSYLVLSTDYLIKGGDGFKINFDKDRSEVLKQIKVRDAIAQALKSKHKQGITLQPAKDGRIQVVQTP